MTAAEVRAEAQKLPPALRDQFLTPNGQQQFVQTVVAKRLLLEEAHRRKLDRSDEIVRQVQELENRLAVEALLDAAKREAGQPTEADLRAWYESHVADFAIPPRVHAGRLQLRGAPKDKALRARAEALRKRLLKGESIASLASLGDGPERIAGGDVGWIAKPENDEMRVALALKRAGEVSDLVESAQGLSMLVALEREEGRTPPFDEVRGLVAGRYAPVHERQVFDRLIEKLKAQANVQMSAAAAR